MPEVSRRTAGIIGSPIRRIAALLERAAANRDIISFGGGAPSLAPPQEILDALAEHLKKKPQKTSAYSSTSGIPKTLELIAEELKRYEKVDVNPENEITLTDGGSEGLFLALNTMINPGDEVIISDPTYLAYERIIKFIGGKPVSIPVKWQEDFQMFPERINEVVNSKTKAIITLSPDNPTGRMLDDKNLKGIVEIAEDKNLWLLTDDIYKYIFYEGKFTNSRRFGGYENTITCCSFSKTASIPGFRLGYAYNTVKVIDRMEKLKQYTSLCPSRPAQILVQKFLENNARIQNEYISKTVIPIYKNRKNFMAKALKEHLPDIGFSMPKGAFYFFVDISERLKKLNMNDEQFSNKLLKEKEVVVIPGRFFGSLGQNHIRLTFVSETEERINQGIKKIAEVLA